MYDLAKVKGLVDVAKSRYLWCYHCGRAYKYGQLEEVRVCARRIG